MFLTRNIKDYISNKNIYFMKDIYCKCENVSKVIIFPIPLYLTMYSALFSLLLSTAFVV